MTTMHREEYLLRKPPNWGEILYQNLKERAKEIETKGVKPPRPNILKMVMSQPVVDGPLDGTHALETLSEDEQCSYFAQYPGCKSLTLQRWVNISEKVLRCISITMGESLEELDLSYSHVRYMHLDILIARVLKLKILKLSACPRLDGACIAVFAKLAQKSITELYVDKCPLFTSEPFMYLAGCLGFNPPKLYKLRALDLGECPVTDEALVNVATCCKLLRFLNLNECSTLTDVGVIALVKANPKLKLINLAFIATITNKSVVAIGKSCSELVSLNLTKCINVSNAGVLAIARGCPKLQALNLAGLIRVDEEPLLPLVTGCLGLLMLNVNGCEQITTRGVQAIVTGRQYIEMSVSFLGFRPVDNHIERKLSGHLIMLREQAEKEISDRQKQAKKEEEDRIRARNQLEFKSCVLIQQYMWRYKCRMIMYRLWQARRKYDGATNIQRVFRGRQGRKIFKRKRDARIRFLNNWPSALAIQRTVRGHTARVKSPHVARVMRDLYVNRRREAEAAIAVRFQAIARRYLAVKRTRAYGETIKRRQFDEANSILIMQMLARRYLSLRELKRRRFIKARKDALESRSAIKIQIWYNECINRYLSKLKGAELMAAGHKRFRVSLILQRSVRGYFGRCRANRMRIKLAYRNYCAILIQKTFRSARILNWRDMRLNVIAAYALDRQYIERRERVAASRKRYERFLQLNQRDSASDSEEAEKFFDPVWEKKFDEKRKKPYWYNEIDNIVTYDEPKVSDAHEKALVNQRVRIFWIVQGLWYDGYVSEFNRKKRRHRIEYDDGDHEWIDFTTEHDRVQIQLEDGSWIMYLMYQSPDILDEWNKVDAQREKEETKKQAWDDASCWKMIVDDHLGLDGRVMYISTRTGEMRAGALFCQNWTVQDDGLGFPCFFNVSTGETEHEDPRFIYDTDENMEAQRTYVLAEANYALYFCKDMYDQYAEAVEADDKRKQHLMCLKVLNSQKPKHLASFLIRLKALYKRQSVMDPADLNSDIHQQIAYMEWLSERLKEMSSQGVQLTQSRREKKKETVEWLQATSGVICICPKCKRRTQRHLDFCPSCGKRNLPPFLGPEFEIMD